MAQAHGVLPFLHGQVGAHVVTGATAHGQHGGEALHARHQTGPAGLLVHGQRMLLGLHGRAAQRRRLLLVWSREL